MLTINYIANVIYKVKGDAYTINHLWSLIVSVIASIVCIASNSSQSIEMYTIHEKQIKIYPRTPMTPFTMSHTASYQQ